MSEVRAHYLGSVFGVRGERGETHVYLKRASSSAAVEVSGPGYGYKGFVQFGRIYFHDDLPPLLFRKRGASSGESFVRWEDVKTIKVEELDLDIFADEETGDSAKAFERMITT